MRTFGGGEDPTEDSEAMVVERWTAMAGKKGLQCAEESITRRWCCEASRCAKMS